MKSKRSILFIIFCACSLILLYFLTDFLAVELREISAVTAESILKLAGTAIQRSGTILTLGKCSFDIIPACNGSTTLQVLFISALFLVLMNNRLLLPKKIVCLFLTIPVALLANGIRLALLVYISNIKGHVIAEGALHNLIGIFGFLLAFTTLLLFSDLLSTSKKQKNMQRRVQKELFISALVFAGVALAPFLSACIRDWIGDRI